MVKHTSCWKIFGNNKFHGPKKGNNNNNKISINVFLNEHCKAMNLTDFMSNLNVSNEDLQYTKEYGYVEGVSNIFKNRLKNMKPTERQYI